MGIAGLNLGNRQTGRSEECSCPAPLIRHGLRRISPSSTAVLKTALSSRYALAAVTALNPASRPPHSGPQPQATSINTAQCRAHQSCR